MPRSGESERAEVVLYSRAGCHLCDEAREAMLELREGGRDFELREVDIESDERLHAELLERIPVIAIAGEVVSELTVDVHAVRARLDTVAA